ncbi:TetR/AcrR family transcriptional regulator C-terminal domain-containing protein [Streptoalloteichus hindustanus]|uniref:Transcriptional regulator, TetR family n=1 Tax=Streptoalloteichus hindustanus TaxID=2017 RepID=A0A1M5FL02_STRHI|nr:TetR/AcrR family transcriptional regulator C-terminal domain-containing protein [Streptoalloteichus hindustanus]SHF91841.1 transcriptional regulator, TetR family [Streptoalloteichus hindustanus]
MPARRTRGQRAGLTRQAVLEAALALVDREGLQALSMRRLGNELGVEAMTLYNHVANKEALLDGLVEQIVLSVAPPQLDASSWQAGMRDFAHALLTALRAHPDVIPLVVSRPATTAPNLHVLESTLRSLHESGFPAHRALDVVYSVTNFVVGHAATMSAQNATEQDTDDDQPGPLLDLDADEFPFLTAAMRVEPRIGAQGRFDFALEAMLAGFEAARTSASAPEPGPDRRREQP